MATDAGPGRKGVPVTEPTVILVHGAMHTPWIFHRLRAELDARGIASLAVQLPSSHPDSTRARGLPEDVAAVEAAVDEVDGPVVLAAHSYGGVPATAAATDSRVGALVYLAAFSLPAGASMMQWMGGGFPPDWVHSVDGLAVKAGHPESTIFSDVDPALTAEAVARLNWQGVGSFTGVLEARPGDETEITYVVATADAALPPEVQEQWAAEAAVRIAVASGHSPHLSHPVEVAAAIEGAVDRLRTR